MSKEQPTDLRSPLRISMDEHNKSIAMLYKLIKDLEERIYKLEKSTK